MTDDRLVAKTEQYREMLEAALAEASPAVEGDAGEAAGDTAEETSGETDGSEAASADGETGRELIGMARNYLEDGRHYEDEGDHVTALAAYSYGHGWLDAGVRSGAIDAEDPELFVVDG